MFIRHIKNASDYMNNQNITNEAQGTPIPNGLPYGDHNIGDLESKNLLIPGKIVVITRNKVSKKYLIVGQGSNRSFLDLETKQHLPPDVVTQGKYSIRELSHVERQLAANEGLVNHLQTPQQVAAEIRRGNSKIEAISFENVITTTKDPNVIDPSIVSFSLNRKIRKQLEYGLAGRLQESVELLKDRTIINRGDARKVAQRAYRKLLDIDNYQDWKIYRSSLSTVEQSILKSIESTTTEKTIGSLRERLNQVIDTKYNRLELPGGEKGQSVIIGNLEEETRKLIEADQDYIRSERAKSTADKIFEHNIIDINKDSKDFTDKVLGTLRQKEADLRINRYNVEANLQMLELQYRNSFEGIWNSKYTDELNRLKRATGIDLTHNAYLKAKHGFGTYSMTDMSQILDQRIPSTNQSAKNKSAYAIHRRVTDQLTKSYVDEYGQVKYGPRNQKTIERLAKNAFKKSVLQAAKDSDIHTKIKLKKYLDNVDTVYREERNIKRLDTRLSAKDPLPKAARMKSGLISNISSLFGFWFYQGMMHSMARKSREMYANFIEEGEIIEANKHSSVETSTRRILSTDFGSVTSKAFSLIKDTILGGRLRSQQFENLLKGAKDNKETIEYIRAAVDPKFVKRKMQDYIRTEAKRFRQTIVHDVKDSLKESATSIGEYMKANSGLVTVVTGSVMGVTYLASSPTEKENINFISRINKNRPVDTYIENSQVYPWEAYSNDYSYNKAALTPWASPTEVKHLIGEIFKHIKFLRTSPVKDRIVHATSRIGRAEFTESVIGQGYQIPITKNNNAYEIFDEARTLINRIANNSDSGQITKGLASREISQATSIQASEITSNLVTRTPIINRDYGRSLREVAMDVVSESTEDTGLLKDQIVSTLRHTKNITSKRASNFTGPLRRKPEISKVKNPKVKHSNGKIGRPAKVTTNSTRLRETYVPLSNPEKMAKNQSILNFGSAPLVNKHTQNVSPINPNSIPDPEANLIHSGNDVYASSKITYGTPKREIYKPMELTDSLMNPRMDMSGFTKAGTRLNIDRGEMLLDYMKNIHVHRRYPNQVDRWVELGSI